MSSCQLVTAANVICCRIEVDPEGGEPGDRGDAVGLEHRPVGLAHASDVDQRVGLAPGGVGVFFVQEYLDQDRVVLSRGMSPATPFRRFFLFGAYAVADRG